MRVELRRPVRVGLVAARSCSGASSAAIASAAATTASSTTTASWSPVSPDGCGSGIAFAAALDCFEGVHILCARSAALTASITVLSRSLASTACSSASACVGSTAALLASHSARLLRIERTSARLRSPRKETARRKKERCDLRDGDPRIDRLVLFLLVLNQVIERRSE